MTLSFVYWFLMLVWLIFGGATWFQTEGRSWPVLGGNIILFLLFLVLGLKVFGFPIQG